eukprot:gene14548-16051_t
MEGTLKELANVSRKKACKFSFEMCIICQSHSASKDKVLQPRSQSLQKLLECIKERAGYLNFEFVDLFQDIKHETVSSISQGKGFYHRQFYQRATNAEHIKRERTAFLSQTGTETRASGTNSDKISTASRKTRSFAEIFDSEMCIICQSHTGDEKGLHEIETMNMDYKLRNAIEKREDDTMRIRMNSASDATAAEIK